MPAAQALDGLLAATPVNTVSLPRTATVVSVRQPVVAACAGTSPPANASALPATTIAAQREASLITESPVH
jgi:hypothetical protein